MHYEEQSDIFGVQQCVFGALEEDKQANGFDRTIMYCDHDRTAGTLGEILHKHMRRGAIVNHDGWAGYRNINWARMGLQHVEHVHNAQGGIHRTMATPTRLKDSRARSIPSNEASTSVRQGLTATIISVRDPMEGKRANYQRRSKRHLL